MDERNNTDTPPSKLTRNWWKVAFFVCLVIFELTREIAVVSNSNGARPNAMAMLYGSDEYVRAQGSWKRIDGGEPLVPTVLTIECERGTGVCLEASVNMNDEYVYAPELNRFNALFGTDTVTYENDSPDCARYSVRLDLKIKKVIAVRERKENPSNPNCANLEPRIEMQLSDGYDLGNDPLKGHFVPLLQIIASLA